MTFIKRKLAYLIAPFKDKIKMQHRINTLEVDNETWFNEVKDFATKNGYAASPKNYKNNPEQYKGHVGDICEAIRVMITGRLKSPDLFSIMKILGKERILKRIEMYKSH